MSTKAPTPSQTALNAVLGDAAAAWTQIIYDVGAMFSPLDLLWKPSKSGFGQMCLLQHKQRTLLYLTPDEGRIWIAMVLGERAYRLAMASDIPVALKEMLSDAKPYVEGRGIRFAVSSTGDIRSAALHFESSL